MQAKEFSDRLHALINEATTEMDRRQVMQIVTYEAFAMHLAHSILLLMNNTKTMDAILEKLRSLSQKEEG